MAAVPFAPPSQPRSLPKHRRPSRGRSGARPPSPHPLPGVRPRLPHAVCSSLVLEIAHGAQPHAALRSLLSGGWCAQAPGSGSPGKSWRCGGPPTAMEVLAATPCRRRLPCRDHLPLPPRHGEERRGGRELDQLLLPLLLPLG
ncbi:uncharacterized protein LOC100192633 [Zea mays]|uniref:Uncharacterized protein n=1 Tax=Zea mays TaxID=4577 RepID=B4FC29_MAIZE|nr:uncharacterized protein LOC100192633 [Zea mays]ACF79672.1 unknown [Zea mays]|eukprot:NP_001131319.1 uncharacterized protein LOC100192633 [Zea mays]